jgi:hypothetical protein
MGIVNIDCRIVVLAHELRRSEKENIAAGAAGIQESGFLGGGTR